MFSTPQCRIPRKLTVMSSQLQQHKRCPPLETDRNGINRLALQPEGYNYYVTRQGHKINYISAGDKGPAVVLLHGFGSSSYHYRYQIPALQEHFRVFAMDGLGMGWSDMPPSIDYTGYNIWIEQTKEFIQDIVKEEKVILIGNSLGGFLALQVAAQHPEVVSKLILLNAAGRFDGKEESYPRKHGVVAAFTDGLLNFVASLYFLAMKSPAALQKTLRSVYVNKDQVDDGLLQSILTPVGNARARETCAKILTATANVETLAPLLNKLKKAQGTNIPLLLVWGTEDPWMKLPTAQEIQRRFPGSELVPVEGASHCSMDDKPVEVNTILTQWLLQQK